MRNPMSKAEQELQAAWIFTKAVFKDGTLFEQKSALTCLRNTVHNLLKFYEEPNPVLEMMKE